MSERKPFLRQEEPAHIAQQFREGELRRREARRAALLRNEAALASEPLTPFDRQVHAAAVESLKKQQLAFERETSVGYWRRLWAALLNK